MKFLRGFGKRLLRLFSLLPCPGCREPEGPGENLFCSSCREKLPLFSAEESHCPGCGGAWDGALAVCSLCLAEPQRPWCKGFALMEYHGYGKELLRRFKFQNAPELARPFGALMAEYFRNSRGNADCITYVPLPLLRSLRRSYNQAELLARRMGRGLSLPVLPTLKRSRHRGKQSLRNRKERHRELKGAFTLLPKAAEALRGKRVLLVDDILTTGATLHAAAQELLKAEPASLEIFVLARTPGRFSADAGRKKSPSPLL